MIPFVVVGVSELRDDAPAVIVEARFGGSHREIVAMARDVVVFQC